MKADFDAAALQYDKTFTNSIIGKLQRKYVYYHVSKLLIKSNFRHVLEINCGTGEDAIWLAQQNYKVFATDISEQMIAVARTKSIAENPKFEVLNIEHLKTIIVEQPFDFIFSNFGGINCLQEAALKLLFENAHKILSEKGKIALVIMPKNTIWEQLYFFLKQNIFKADLF